MYCDTFTHRLLTDASWPGLSLLSSLSSSLFFLLPTCLHSAPKFLVFFFFHTIKKYALNVDQFTSSSNIELNAETIHAIIDDFIIVPEASRFFFKSMLEKINLYQHRQCKDLLALVNQPWCNRGCGQCIYFFYMFIQQTINGLILVQSQGWVLVFKVD